MHKGRGEKCVRSERKYNGKMERIWSRTLRTSSPGDETPMTEDRIPPEEQEPPPLLSEIQNMLAGA